jgi:outer membrane protein assembly factor BamD
MGKPDRDYTHARRAEEEYRQLLMQYPDSKLAPVARQRLLEVQEVLAEREFRIQRYYFTRGSLLASIARGKTLTDTYPLYSKADEALFLLGQAYEQQVDRTRASSLSEAVKQRLTKDYLDEAAEAYSRIITRYPAMPRYKDARLRLAAINRPVPEPTADAIALNKKELASRTPTTTYERFVTNMGKRPDLSEATRVGVPTMVDPQETDAPKLARELDSIVKSETEAKSGTGKVTVAAVGGGAAVPSSDSAPHSPEAAVNASDIPAPAPSQLNEAASSSTGQTASSSSTAPNTKDDAKNSSSSRKAKKKHHLRVHLPF